MNFDMSVHTFIYIHSVRPISSIRGQFARSRVSVHQYICCKSMHAHAGVEGVQEARTGGDPGEDRSDVGWTAG